MLRRVAHVLAAFALGCGPSSNTPPEKTKSVNRGEDPKAKAVEDNEPEEPPPTEDEPGHLSFDAAKLGVAPPSFQIAETNGTKTLATWKVVADDTAPTPPNVFALTGTENQGQTYNLAIAKDLPPVEDIDVSVMLRADTGEEDQGGGLAFRLKGPGDYYIARWNPLENNAKFYVVRGSVRTAIAKVNTDLDRTQWHSMRVVAKGPSMELFLDEKLVLEAQDETHKGSGLIALWTKADAATSFDDLRLAD